jgi:transcription elongation GreA/GreB family factor
MSRAFTREDDSESAIADLGERPVSPHRNLVTPNGLAMIDENLSRLRENLAMAEAESDRERIATISRDLRYWSARRESAELSTPDPDSKVVRFGMTVTIEGEDGARRKWTIVGEDEADAAKGRISHVSPMAQALFGRSTGEIVSAGGKQWEVIGFRSD